MMACVPVRRAALLAMTAVVLAGAASAGCGWRSHRAACDAPVHEQLDPASTQHLFSGAAEPTYLSDPPTSGPHRLGNHPTGVLSAPISRPVQVAMLEGGAVLLQYRTLPAARRSELEKLAGGAVTVAPNPSLPAPVVATAWTFKQTCRSVDPPALRRFIAAHAGKGA